MLRRPSCLIASLAAASLVACTDDAPSGLTARASLARNPVASDAPVSVVMSGLDAPRGLAFGPEGGLYVAEAGTTAINGPCVVISRGSNCYSGTGAVSRLWKGEQTRILSGLPSAYNPATTDIVGPSDIDFQGRGNGYLTIGWGADPALRAALGSVGARFGTLNRFNPGGQLDVVADISAFERAQNPAGGPYDSNPFGVLAEGGRQFVADAGGNSLVQVEDGVVSLVAVFAPIPAPAGSPGPPTAEAVPTRVSRGPDGALYVSTLTGVPFRPGTAAIYRVIPGAAPQVYAGGLSFVTDFAFAGDGTLYVLQFGSPAIPAAQGAVIRIAPNNGARSTVIDALPAPTGLTIGPDGALYVSINSRVPATGQVLRIVP
jgi:hypothetical protein